MPCVSVPELDGILTVSGPTYKIFVGGKAFWFELPYGCGLCVLDRRTMELRKRDPGKLFWDAVELWRRGGKRVTENHQCVVPRMCFSCQGVGSTSRQISKRASISTGRCEECKGEGVIFIEGDAT